MLPSLGELRSAISYDPKTGLFAWLATGAAYCSAARELFGEYARTA